MLWFVASGSVLEQELSVVSLFPSWGGEALYGLHEDDPEIGPLLRGIGTATIVVAALPVADFELHTPAAQHLAEAFMHRRGLPGVRLPEVAGKLRVLLAT
jgi:hypothetical protein